MKSNRTHTPPPKIEDLGDGTYYYNFRVIATEVFPEEESEEMEEPYMNYDYDQVRCHFPIEEEELRTVLDAQGYGDHEINLELTNEEF